MTVFLTGGTGYLGGYVVDRLLRDTSERIALLVRAKDRSEAENKLWRSLQLHRSGQEFWEGLSRIDFVHGDLHAPNLGLDPNVYRQLYQTSDSVLHIAASLNRKSEKACLNTNLRGTLSVIKLAQAIDQSRGLRRFSHVSTVAVAGQRSGEHVREDEAIEWTRSDYDPYARTKKFCEHMARELLPDVPLTFFRPSIVLGDSVRHKTTQFDMARAVAMFAQLRVLPLDPDSRLDIVNADYVGRAVATLHLKPRLRYDTYHLASGLGSCTVRDIARAFERDLGRPRYRYVPQVGKGFGLAVDAANAVPGRGKLASAGALMKVFWPYVIYDTVFDNQRIVDAMGHEPTPFASYAAPLIRFCEQHRFRYPYAPLPERSASPPVTARAEPG